MITNMWLMILFFMLLYQEDGSLGWQIGFVTAGLIFFRIITMGFSL